MFGKQQVFLSTIITSALGGEPIESLFARQLADENGWHYIGLEEGYYKFHDVINNKEVSMSEDDMISNGLKR